MAKATNNENLNIFAKRLGELIKENGYTHETVAKGVGVTRQGVGKWVSGESVPDVLTAAKLAVFFDVSVDYLSGNSEIKTNNMDIQGICNYLGITEQTVEGLIEIKMQQDCLNFCFDNGQSAICSPCISGNYFQKCIEYLIKNELGEFAKDIISNYISLCEYEKKTFSDIETISSYEDAKKHIEAEEKIDMLKYRNYHCCVELLERFIDFLRLNDDCINSRKEYMSNVLKFENLLFIEDEEEGEPNAKHNPKKE